MRTNIATDDKLMAKAMKASRLETKTIQNPQTQ